MPGSRVTTPPTADGRLVYTGVAGAHGDAQIGGGGKPAKGSGTWLCPEFTVIPMSVQWPVAVPLTSSVYPSVENLPALFWSFSEALLPPEFTRMPPPCRCTSALLADQNARLSGAESSARTAYPLLK